MTGTTWFRRLWQPPARYEDRRTDRRVTFLELFFDLVFVVVISQLADRLAEHPSWSGIGWFVFLFYVVWSPWLNGTFYHDLHGTTDVSVRVFTFAQMLAVASMAAFIADVPGRGSSAFALGYAAQNLVLVIMWFRTGLHDPAHRPGSFPYSSGYLIATILFAVSAGIEESTRYPLWVAGLVVQVAGQVIGFRRWTPPAGQTGDAVIPVTPALIERLGLFVIIVLGEVIVGAVNGMARTVPVEPDALPIGLLGIVVAIGLWWIYFDLVSNRAPISRMTQLWVFLHFPLVVSIAAGGAGVLATVQDSGRELPDAVRWLLVAALAAAVLSVALLTMTLEARRAHRDFYRPVKVVLIASALLISGVGLTDWGAKASLATMTVLLLAPVAMGLVLWLRHMDREPVAFD
jgi:low temperature requirement protein LtrA